MTVPDPNYYPSAGPQGRPQASYGSAIQPGPGVPQHLVGTVPVSLGKRILMTLANAFAIAIVGNILGSLWDAAMGPSLQLHSTGTSWDFVVATTGGLITDVLWLAAFIAYLVTGYPMPFGPLMKVRQVKVERPAVPGWAGLGKYVLEYIATLLLIFPYLIIVFGTRNAVQRHWIDRLTGIIVLDVGGGRDPLKR